MDIFLARQPIFNRNQTVIAYELLHRSCSKNYFMGTDGDIATSELISNAFLDIGLDRITRGKRAFINFTKKLLEDETALFLPKDAVAIEILEDVEPDAAALAACKKLRQLGYTLVLDDCDCNMENRAFLDLVDIVKVDFQRVKLQDRPKMMSFFKSKSYKLLAEKVETVEDFGLAMESGFDLLQGYFFCKPVIVTGRGIAANKLQSMRLLQEIYKNEMDFDTIERLIKEDATLSYKLLRCINSLAYATRFKISSIRQAMALLGQKEIIKWASLACLHTLSSDKPNELLVTAIARAKFCESIAIAAKLKDSSSEYFITGLFSLLDTFLDRPMEEILKELPLAEKIKRALLSVPGGYRKVLDIFLLYERGYFDEAFEIAIRDFNVDDVTVMKCYLDSIDLADIKWA